MFSNLKNDINKKVFVYIPIFTARVALRFGIKKVGYFKIKKLLKKSSGKVPSVSVNFRLARKLRKTSRLSAAFFLFTKEKNKPKGFVFRIGAEDEIRTRDGFAKLFFLLVLSFAKSIALQTFCFAPQNLRFVGRFRGAHFYGEGRTKILA